GAKAAHRPRRMPSWNVVAGATVVVVALAAGIPLVLGGGGSSIASIGVNSVGVLDLASHHLTSDVQVGANPTSVAAGAGAVWVADGADNTVHRVDPHSHATQTIA